MHIVNRTEEIQSALSEIQTLCDDFQTQVDQGDSLHELVTIHQKMVRLAGQSLELALDHKSLDGTGRIEAELAKRGIPGDLV